MTRLNLAPPAVNALRALSEPTEVCDDSGATLGYYYPATGTGGTPALGSPFSREELELRRQLRSGRSLPEILKDLGAT
jgi:hypothetical protein